MKSAVVQAPLSAFLSSGNVTGRKTVTTERMRSTVVGVNRIHAVKEMTNF